MMNQWIVPSLNLRHQRQEQVEGHEERNTSPHVQTDQNLSYVVPMPNYEVAELTWENGQLSLHGFGGNNFPSTQTKPTWSREEDTLESIVHQATFNNNISKSDLEEVKCFPSISSGGKWGENSSASMSMQTEHNQDGNLSASLGGKWKENLGHVQIEENGGIKSSFIAASYGGKREENSGSGLKKKRMRSEEKCGKKKFEVEESESATFCRDFTDKNMRTWASFETPGSLKNTGNTDDNSACHDCSENQNEERVSKEERLTRSTARRSHAAAIHNQSERRRRDRINEKMKALQKLVPNASKTDKASMLDEVIEHLKQLQAQIQMMSSARNMPQMMIPFAMQQQQQQQQQLQMSLLARMGMGMGMLDVNNLARNVPQSLSPFINPVAPLCGTTPSFVSPPYVMPPVVPPLPPLKANLDGATINTSIPFNDAYNTFLAQHSMNMDFFNKMSSLYRQQQATHPSKKPINLSQPKGGRGK